VFYPDIIFVVQHDRPTEWQKPSTVSNEATEDQSLPITAIGRRQ